MESFFSRYRNEWLLVAVLFSQLIMLATQVRVAPAKTAIGDETTVSDPRGTRLIRVWAIGIIAPFQKFAVNTSKGIRGLWSGYVDLRGVRRENEQLRRQLTELRFERARIEQDAQQGRRLQALLDFKQQFIHKTVAAQVIGASGAANSRVIYIDRGEKHGIAAGMAVITPDGIVGKVTRADGRTSQVLLVNDPQSGAGVMIERLRLNGILKGTGNYYPEMQNVMADEKIEVGDEVITTGGDRVFPRGLPVGKVKSFYPDRDKDPFLTIKIEPAVQLGRLEEVLVVTEIAERTPDVPAEASVPQRAADLLAERLPSIKKKPADEKAEERRAQTLTESVPGGVDTAPAEQIARPAPAPARPTTGPSEIKPVVPNTRPAENESPGEQSPR